MNAGNTSAAIIALTIAAGALSPAAAQNPQARAVISTDFGDDWPLTSYSAMVNCLEGRYAIAITDTGIYAMNGTAKDVSGQRGWEDVSKISKPHPEYEEVEADITPLLNLALEICE